MSETITLPRSGVVLTRSLVGPRGLEGVPQYETVVGGVQLLIRWYSDGTVLAKCGLLASAGLRGKVGRDKSIAWLDARVLELRAALMPGDARERIARALEDNGHLWDGTDAGYGFLADAVLKEIGGER